LKSDIIIHSDGTLYFDKICVPQGEVIQKVLAEAIVQSILYTRKNKDVS